MERVVVVGLGGIVAQSRTNAPPDCTPNPLCSVFRLRFEYAPWFVAFWTPFVFPYTSVHSLGFAAVWLPLEVSPVLQPRGPALILGFCVGGMD